MSQIYAHICKRQSEVLFSHKKHTSTIVFVWIQDLKHNKAEIKVDIILAWDIITRQNIKIHKIRNVRLTNGDLPGFLRTVARQSP